MIIKCYKCKKCYEDIFDKCPHCGAGKIEMPEIFKDIFNTEG